MVFIVGILYPDLCFLITVFSNLSYWPFWFLAIKIFMGGFPGGAVVENLPANAGDTGSSPGLGRSHMPQSN